MKKLDGYPERGIDHCVYQFNGQVYNETVNNITTTISCNENDSMWLPGPTYDEDKWTRYTDTDRPYGYAWFTAGATPWNELNKMWE